ncbi:glycoside hydrolase family 13 protein [Anaerocolumna aminovalerica]|uniref:glycoside hydrolase family 13 protein n=1 Tax=Anaerocolumna aminovalerica TaxID=1527 RepID=UPI00248B4029|nr:glycoside hydrolase family 13 protein [Anaerocolumna aminovalerica]
MNLQAICHIPKSNYAYPYKENELHIRLRTAKDDVDQVEIIHGIKYDWKNNERHVMKKILTDEFYDYYQYNIICEDSRIGYYFGLTKGEKKLYYTELGFADKFNDDFAYCYFFQYPYINKVDVHKEPSWVQEAIFYQIFVERFFNGDVKNSPPDLTPWDADPDPKSFYGGDLKGIIDKLDYLKDLGINGIYLTPIFQSPSNHKYDTVNYFEIDNYFGDKEVFGELVQRAHDRGIRIVLDAVFNHCSNLFEPFLDAVEKGRESKYWDWFFIEDYPVKMDPPNYKTFGHVAYMPKLNTANPELKEYLLSAIRYWTTEYNIDGWRLDVSDEIDHLFWRDFRRVVKEINEEAVIIGENWHNALPWLMGDQFDSVMNYQVTKLSQDFFARNEISARSFEKGLSSLLIRYPDQVNEAMLNLLDSHDTERFLYTCQGRKEKLKNAAAFLFGYIGMPCTYYGTEIGMTGNYDPGCRKGFDWNQEHWEMELYQYYKKLISIRKKEKALQYGDITFLSTDSLFVMKREYNKECIYILINQREDVADYNLPKSSFEYNYVKELLSESEWKVEQGTLRIQIPAFTAFYIKLAEK